MATKRTRTKTNKAQDSAHSAWLAGLGAVSIAQKRGGRLLGGLIAEGKDFQSRVRKLVRETSADTLAHAQGALAPVRVGLKSNARKAGAALQHGVGVVLAQFGIPSKADFEELTQRITALSRRLKTSK